jgi:uncharacterized RDD family membrane protein YckC
MQAADSSSSIQVDSLRRFETPEGIEIELRLAGPVPRAGAFAIDLLIRVALYIAITPLAGLAGLGVGLMLLALFLLEWFYPVFFELRSGATPGKRAVGLTVVHADGTPVGPSASLLRNLLRALDFLPLFYAVGLVAMLMDRDFRRLGDLAAGTLVVYREAADKAPKLPRHQPIAPPVEMTPALQQAVLAFAERSTELSPARRAELAELSGLADSDKASGVDAAGALLGIANWIARGKPDAPAAQPGCGRSRRSPTAGAPAERTG